MAMQHEQWKPVIGYEGRYEVSNLGQIRSLPGHHVRARILRQAWRGRFLAVDLSQDGYRKSYSVSRIVATAFIPNPENKPQVNHKDANRENNAVSNLEWVTAKENTAHASGMGLRKILRGEDAGQAKLTEAQVHEIKAARLAGGTTRAIGERFGVSHQTISDICNGKKWKHVSFLQTAA